MSIKEIRTFDLIVIFFLIISLLGLRYFEKTLENNSYSKMEMKREILIENERFWGIHLDKSIF